MNFRNQLVTMKFNDVKYPIDKIEEGRLELIGRVLMTVGRKV